MVLCSSHLASGLQLVSATTCLCQRPLLPRLHQAVLPYMHDPVVTSYFPSSLLRKQGQAALQDARSSLTSPVAVNTFSHCSDLDLGHARNELLSGSSFLHQSSLP